MRPWRKEGVSYEDHSQGNWEEICDWEQWLEQRLPDEAPDLNDLDSPFFVALYEAFCEVADQKGNKQ